MEHKIFEQWSFSAKTPQGVANEIKRKLVKTFGLNPEYVLVWSPEKSMLQGYGKTWMVAAEEAPFEWTTQLTGWCKGIYQHPTVFVECQNNWAICLMKR